jgi:hypothetical protein
MADVAQRIATGRGGKRRVQPGGIGKLVEVALALRMDAEIVDGLGVEVHSDSGRYSKRNHPEQIDRPGVQRTGDNRCFILRNVDYANLQAAQTTFAGIGRRSGGLRRCTERAAQRKGTAGDLDDSGARERHLSISPFWGAGFNSTSPSQKCGDVPGSKYYLVMRYNIF